MLCASSRAVAKFNSLSEVLVTLWLLHRSLPQGLLRLALYLPGDADDLRARAFAKRAVDSILPICTLARLQRAATKGFRIVAVDSLSGRAMLRCREPGGYSCHEVAQRTTG